MTNKAPSNKLSLGALGGTVPGALSGLLVALIPAWHNGLPPAVAFLIPVAVTVAGYFGTGYAVKHQATVTEVERAVQEAQSLLALVPAPAAPVTAPPGTP